MYTCIHSGSPLLKASWHFDWKFECLTEVSADGALGVAGEGVPLADVLVAAAPEEAGVAAVVLVPVVDRALVQVGAGHSAVL